MSRRLPPRWSRRHWSSGRSLGRRRPGMCACLMMNRRLFASVIIIPRIDFLQKWLRSIQGVTWWLGLMFWPLIDDNTAIFMGHHRRGECVAVALFGSYLITWAPNLALEQCVGCEKGVWMNRTSVRRLRRPGSGSLGKCVVVRKHNSHLLEAHSSSERENVSFPSALVCFVRDFYARCIIKASPKRAFIMLSLPFRPATILIPASKPEAL